MTNSINTSYFHELTEKDPEYICSTALCDYDTGRKCYILSVWNEDYGIYPYESKILHVQDKKSNVNTFLGLFIIYYLLRSKGVPISREWISEKDVPGGATFFRGPHTIPTHLIEERYGNDLQEFKGICVQLHGTPIDMADAAYVFKIAPRIPVAVQFWMGDNEFPPQSKILFDRTIIEHLAPDIIFCLAYEVCTRIGEAKRKNVPGL